MPNDMDWFGLMRGITEAHVKSLGSPSGDGVSGTVEGHGLRLAESRASETCTVAEVADLANVFDCQLKTESSGRHSENQASPTDSKDIASPALASEDALAGTESGGEHPINSSPLHKFKEVTPMRDEPPVAIQEAEKRPDNTHTINKNNFKNLTPGVRQGGVEGQPIEAPPLKFPADDRFADNIARFMDAFAVCEERSRR